MIYLIKYSPTYK